MKNYKTIFPGYLKQIELTGQLPDYSSNYSKNRYDTYNTNESISELRYSLLDRVIKNFDSVTDFGYGNGSFMYFCSKKGKKVFGFDISDYPVPEKCQKLNHVNDVEVDVVTFFDSIEHLIDISPKEMLTYLRTKYVAISVPWYHEEQGEEWFLRWKHRRENEHIHHFDSHGLVRLVNESGYKILYLGNDEDLIRKPVDKLSNILTILAKKL